MPCAAVTDPPPLPPLPPCTVCSVSAQSSWEKPAGFVAEDEEKPKARAVVSVPRHQSLDAGLGAARGGGAAPAGADDGTLHRLIWSRHAAAGRTRKLSKAVELPRDAMAQWQARNGGRAAALHARAASLGTNGSGRVTDV